MADKTWLFESWSDGAAQTHDIVANGSTILADFLEVSADAPAAPAAPGPEPPAPPQPQPPPAGTGTQPPAAFEVSARHLRAALRRGVVVRLACGAACGAVGRLDVSAKTARRHRLGRQVTRVARGTARRATAGRMVLALRFTERATLRLRRARRVSVILRVTVDQGGKRRAWRRTLSLVR
jgi:hypothetical protein